MADYDVSVEMTGDAGEFQKAFDVAVKAVEDFNAKMEGVSGKIKPVNDAFGALVSNFGKISSKLIDTKGIDKALSGISTSFTKVDGAFKKSVSGMKTLCTNTKDVVSDFSKSFSYAGSSIKGVFGAFDGKGNGIPRFVQGLREAGYSLSFFESGSQKAQSGIQTILQKAAGFAPVFLKGFSIAAGVGVIFAGLGMLQNGFGEKINSMICFAVEKGPELITSFCDGIISSLPNLMAQGGYLIMSLLNAITENLPAVLAGGVGILCALVDGVSSTLPYLIPTALELILTLVNGIITNLPQIVESGLNLIVALADGIVGAIPTLIEKAPLIIGNLISSIAQMLPQIITTGITLITNLAIGLIQAIPEIVNAVPQIITNIKSAFADFDWGEIGRNMMDGIKNGIGSVASNLVQAAKDAGRAALNGIKDILGIHSPSCVFRDEVGQMMALGLGMGFEANLPVKAMKGNVADAVKDISAYSSDMSSSARMVSANRMLEDVSLSYGQSVAQGNASNYQSNDISGIGDYIIAVSNNQMQSIADALEKGIAGIRMVNDRREIGRMMCDMGFVRA